MAHITATQLACAAACQSVLYGLFMCATIKHGPSGAVGWTGLGWGRGVSGPVIVRAGPGGPVVVRAGPGCRSDLSVCMRDHWSLAVVFRFWSEGQSGLSACLSACLSVGRSVVSTLRVYLL